MLPAPRFKVVGWIMFYLHCKFVYW